MYYAVTGKVPFPGGTTAEKARAHCELRPLDPRRLNHALSDSFVDLLADMMTKDPAERIASAAEVVQRLAPWANRAPWNQRAADTGPPALDPALPGAPPTLVTAAPLIPAPPPPPAGSSASLLTLVLPPPVVRPLTPLVATPLPVAVLRLRDTVPDLPSPPEPVSSDSQASGDSVSLIVVTQRPAKALLVLLLVLLPIALAAAALLIGWLWDVWF
jgi:serine/threonine protein kinase